MRWFTRSRGLVSVFALDWFHYLRDFDLLDDWIWTCSREVGLFEFLDLEIRIEFDIDSPAPLMEWILSLFSLQPVWRVWRPECGKKPMS